MENLYAKQRIIRDIENEDLRIQITGYVEGLVKNDHFVLDDKTGEIKVNIKEYNFNFKNNDLVNVIGDLDIKMGGEKMIQADIIQDMNKLNFKYYQKLYELKLELEKE
jgi:uncharacterized protein YdeI (BOF family)